MRVVSTYRPTEYLRLIERERRRRRMGVVGLTLSALSLAALFYLLAG
jgi:hypothetical protein